MSLDESDLVSSTGDTDDEYETRSNSDSQNDAAEDADAIEETFDTNELVHALRHEIKRRIRSWEQEWEAQSSEVLLNGDSIVKRNQSTSKFNRYRQEMYESTASPVTKTNRLQEIAAPASTRTTEVVDDDDDCTVNAIAYWNRDTDTFSSAIKGSATKILFEQTVVTTTTKTLKSVYVSNESPMYKRIFEKTAQIEKRRFNVMEEQSEDQSSSYVNKTPEKSGRRSFLSDSSSN